MARFFGRIGFAESSKGEAGVFEDVVVEHEYYGDVLRNSRKLDNGAKINDDISVSNSISIVADAYAVEHFFAMRYVIWMGVKWKASDVRVEHPRLIIQLGDVYNGPTPAAADPA